MEHSQQSTQTPSSYKIGDLVSYHGTPYIVAKLPEFEMGQGWYVLCRNLTEYLLFEEDYLPADELVPMSEDMRKEIPESHIDNAKILDDPLARQACLNRNKEKLKAEIKMETNSKGTV